jgi:hypothetical protein
MIDAWMIENQPIQWFFPFLGKPIDSKYNYSLDDVEAINRFKVFGKAIHFGDPDVKKRSVASATMSSVALELADQITGPGIYVQTNPGSNDFTTRRDKLKVLLARGIEVNDTPGTQKWIEAIDGARYPQRQETSQATNAITLPIHDWTSHHRTATEYLAVNFEIPMDDEDEDTLEDDGIFDEEGFLV